MVMRICELRQQAGMKQRELAVSMEVSRTTVTQWESEVSLPRTRQLPDLARVLGCSIDELFVPEPASPMEAV